MYTISTPTRRTSVRRGASTKSSSGSTNADVSKTVLSATATRSPPRAARAGNGTDRVAKRGRNLDDGSDEGDSDSAVSGSRRCRQATEVTKVAGQVPASPIRQPPATHSAAIGPPELGHTRASGERYHPTSPRSTPGATGVRGAAAGTDPARPSAFQAPVARDQRPWYYNSAKPFRGPKSSRSCANRNGVMSSTP